MSRRRSAVYIVLSETVGHNLVFRHYTNKVVVGKYPEMKAKVSEKANGAKRKKNNIE